MVKCWFSIYFSNECFTNSVHCIHQLYNETKYKSTALFKLVNEAKIGCKHKKIIVVFKRKGKIKLYWDPLAALPSTKLPICCERSWKVIFSRFSVFNWILVWYRFSIHRCCILHTLCTSIVVTFIRLPPSPRLESLLHKLFTVNIFRFFSTSNHWSLFSLQLRFR